jgi:hypothetical protein
MAISGNRAQFETALQSVCMAHRMNRDDFIEAQQDVITGHVMLTFKAPVFSPDMVVLANKIHSLLNDEFRGEVARAAAPALSAGAATLADAILNPKLRIITIDPAAYNLKEYL